MWTPLTLTVAESGHNIASYPSHLGYFPPHKPDPTLLDFLTPQFPAPSQVSTKGSPYTPVFAGHSGGGMGLIYLRHTGNEAAISRLRAIALANNDCEFTVRVFDSTLERARVEELMAVEGVEELRTLLTAAMPEGPAGDGWGDRDAWTVGELDQRTMKGTVALLPLENPPGCPYDNYATQVCSQHLRDFVRRESGVEDKRVDAIEGRGRGGGGQQPVNEAEL